MNNTYKYDDAEEIIKIFYKFNIFQIKNAEEWIRFFENTIYREKIDIRVDQITNKMMKYFVQIPNRPEDYYRELVSWEDFLGLRIEQCDKLLALIKEKTTGSEKANQNIIKQYSKGEWDNMGMNEDATNIVKKYLFDRFGITHQY